MSDLLQIHVPKTSYKAGDTVSGSVYLISEKEHGQEVAIESISISFTGRLSPTRYWPRVPRSIHLFAFKKTLLAGPTTLRITSVRCEDNHSWPFTFSFPLACNAVQYDGPDASPLSLFNTDHNQPLPPSFSTFSDERNPRDAVSIIYELQAALLSPSTAGHRPIILINRLELNLYVPRNSEQSGLECTNKIQRIICQTLDLFPEKERELAKRPLTLREKLGLKPASTDHYPKAIFDAKLQILSSAIIGQPLPVFLHINYDFANSTIRASPAVHLKKVAIRLREDTSMLVPKPGPVDREQEHAGWMKTFQLAVQDFDKEVPLENGFLDMRKIIDLTLKDDLVPTLKTFNIARSYRTQVNVTLECAGKVCFIYSNYNPCTLLAKQFDPHVPQYAQPAAPSVMVSDLDDPPPPYETVEQAAAPSQSTQASQQRRRKRRNRKRHGAFQNLLSVGGAGGGGGGGGGSGGC